MRSGPWILLLLACGVIAAVLQLWSGQARETSASLLQTSTERLEGMQPDFERCLLELTRGLDLLRGDLESDDPAVAADARTIGADLLESRARVHYRLANWTLARRDASRAVDEFGGNAIDLLELACESALKGGDEIMALELAERLLRDAPDRAQGNAYRGAARMAMVRRVIEQVTEILHEDLPESDVVEAVPQIRRAMALGPDSPLFEAALEAVALNLDRASSREKALELVRRGASWLRTARRDFVDSLGIEPSLLATEGFQEILFNAGHQKNAAVFGRLLLDLPQVSLPSPTLLRTIEAWIGLEQPDRARSLLRSVAKVQPQTLDFRLIDHTDYERWGIALYRLEEWRYLGELGAMFWKRRWMVGEPSTLKRFLAIGKLYTLLATVAQDRTWAKHLGPLYLSSDVRPPFPGAELATHLAMAKVGRMEKDVRLERNSIGAATDFAGVNAPEHLREQLGDAWRERAQTFRELDQAPQEEDALAKAMTVWPPLRKDLEAKWANAGRRSLVSRRRDFQAKRDEYIEFQTYQPESQLGSFELIELAQAFYEAEDLFGASSYLALCYDDYPDFPMALQLQAKVAFRSEDFEQAAEASLKLLESGGGTLKDVASLLELPIERLPGKLGIRWFRAVPRTHALLAMLDRLPSGEKHKLLLSSLLSQNALQPLRGEPLRRAAGLCASLGRWDECVELLELLKTADPEFEDLAGVSLLASLKASALPGKDRRVRKLVDLIMSAPRLKAETLIAAIDQLHGSGRASLAVQTVESLAKSAVARSGAADLRNAIHAINASQPEIARTRLLEASLNQDATTIEFGRLVVALEAGRWADVSASARILENIGELSGPLERALLLGLRGGPTQIRRALEYLDLEPTQRGTPSPLVPLARMCLLASDDSIASTWEPDARGLIQGQPFVGRLNDDDDPREILAVLLATRMPAWPIWALARVESLPRQRRLSSWGVTLYAAAIAELGELDRAQEVLSALAGPQTVNFPPAWFLLEQLVLLQVGGDTTDQGYITTRGLRTLAVGSEGIDDFEAEIVAINMAEWKGEHQEAILRLQELVKSTPGVSALEVQLARDLQIVGRNAEAVDLFRKLLDSRSPEAVGAIPDFIEALRLATEVQGVIHERARWTLLESLEHTYPDDPAIVRERARLQIEDSSTDQYGVARAWELLDDFRNRTRDQSIDDLRDGEAENWLELVLRYDPVRARKFALSELHANPASPDSRWMWAKVLSENGELHEATEELARSTAAVAHAPSLRLHARLLAELGEEPKRIQGLIAAVRVAEGLRKADPELIYIEAVANLNGELRDESMDNLAFLWTGRKKLSGRVSEADIGIYLSQAYLRRGQDDDSLQAGAILDELLLAEREPVRRDFLRAMAHLARHHAPRALRDALKPPPSEEDVARLAQ